MNAIDSAGEPLQASANTVTDPYRDRAGRQWWLVIACSSTAFTLVSFLAMCVLLFTIGTKQAEGD